MCRIKRCYLSPFNLLQRGSVWVSLVTTQRANVRPVEADLEGGVSRLKRYREDVDGREAGHAYVKRREQGCA